MSSSIPAPSLSHFWPKADTADLSVLQARLHWTLRVTCALCFIGHGAWGVITKAGWLPFFDVVAIPHPIAWKLMPLVGGFDIAMGLLLLWTPRRAILGWMFGWTVWTAALRPLAGFGMWEFWERAGNYGPPLALLLMGGALTGGVKRWFGPMESPPLTEALVHKLHWLLRGSLATLLVGHGAFALFQQKDQLAGHLSVLGLSDHLVAFGAIEFALAAAVLLRPAVPLLWFVLFWKLGSELLYPLSGGLIDGWETVERWGDYGIPLALIHIAQWRKAKRSS